MPDASSFSPDYVSARARFRAAALRAGADLDACLIDLKGPTGEDLTIDLARLGSPQPRRVVVITSGLHGIEGFVGSAVQCALLEEGVGSWSPAPDQAVLLIHALNPWGMAHGRRVNEDNTDLNRNFLGPEETWRGLPEGFMEAEHLLHPRGARPVVDLFLARALILALRKGREAVHAPAAGQYERPRGLFFGGNAPSRSQLRLREVLRRWWGEPEEVLHLDLHSGIGAWGQAVLLTDEPEDTPAYRRLKRGFEPVRLLSVPYSQGVRGAFLPWIKEQIPQAHYQGLTVEFGTVRPLRLLAALREENRAWHYEEPGSPVFVRATEALSDVLVPRSRRWRDRVAPLGVRIAQSALRVGLGATVSTH